MSTHDNTCPRHDIPMRFRVRHRQQNAIAPDGSFIPHAPQRYRMSIMRPQDPIARLPEPSATLPRSPAGISVVDPMHHSRHSSSGETWFVATFHPYGDNQYHQSQTNVHQNCLVTFSPNTLHGYQNSIVESDSDMENYPVIEPCDGPEEFDYSSDDSDEALDLDLAILPKAPVVRKPFSRPTIRLVNDPEAISDNTSSLWTASQATTQRAPYVQDLEKDVQGPLNPPANDDQQHPRSHRGLLGRASLIFNKFSNSLAVSSRDLRSEASREQIPGAMYWDFQFPPREPLKEEQYIGQTSMTEPNNLNVKAEQRSCLARLGSCFTDGRKHVRDGKGEKET